MLLSVSSPICEAPLPMVELATANSPRKPRRWFCLSQLVKAVRRCTPMFGSLLKMVEEVPEPSLSRYWWTSKAKFCAGSTMLSMAVELGVPYQVADQVQAPVQPLPGTRIRLLAPAARMAEMAALLAETHCSVGMVLGSFIRLKTTLGLDL